MKTAHIVRLAAFVSLALCGLTASAFTVQTSPYANRDDFYARPFVAYGRAVMQEVSREMHARYGTEFTFLGENGKPEPSVPSADIMAASFETPELSKDWLFCPQPLGLVHFSVYAREDRAGEFLDRPISDWPKNLKVAYSPFALGDVSDREEFFARHGLEPLYVSNPASLGAVEDVRTNACDVLFLYTVPGLCPSGMKEVAHVSERPWGVLVRRSRLWMKNELPRAMRRSYVGNLPLYDELRRKHLGLVPPAKRIRVAAFRYGGLCDRSAFGGYSGLLPEWLERIARLNHWSVDYVFGGFEEGVQDVKDGKLDLIGGISPDYDRLESFVLPHRPIARIRLSLFAAKDSGFRAHDPSSWGGMRVGYLSGATSSRRMRDHLMRLRQDLVFIPYQKERYLLEGYAAGEVNAIVHVQAPARMDDRVLCSLPAQSIYFGVARGRADLIAGFDRAMGVIDEETPGFADDLRWRHLGARRNEMPSFAESEGAYLAQRAAQGTPVRVMVSRDAVRYDANGDRCGFLVSLLDELATATGLTVDLVEAYDEVSARTRFRSGDVDLWIPYPKVLDSALEARLLLASVPMPQGVVTRRDDDRPSAQLKRLAVRRDDFARFGAYREAGLEDRVVLCDDVFQAVASGQADCTVLDYGLALRALNGRDDRLTCRLRERDPYEGRVAVLASDQSPSDLCSALAKVLAHIDLGQVSDLCRQSEIETKRSHDWNQLWRQAKPYVVLALVLVLVIAVLVIASLIRAERVSRAALRSAEAAAKAKTRFLSTMSHELRTPLNAVIGYADFLSRDGRSHMSESDEEAVRCIRSSGGALLALINDVLDLSKFDAGLAAAHEGTCSFSRLVREMHDVFAMRLKARGVTGSFDCDPYLPTLRLSEARMRQVLVNLVGNAAKFTERGSVSLVVRAKADEARRRTVTITVSDTGCGIPEESRASIFDPFVQDISTRMARKGDQTGTGLGLAIVRQIVEAAGGTLSLDSEVGKGSTFTAVIPDIEPVTEVVTEDGRPVVTADLRPLGRVLVADDVLLNRRVLELHLKRLGASMVVHAEDGAAAVGLCEHQSFDVIFTDLWMPGLDGCGLVRKLREMPQHRDTPIVAVTADIDCGEQFDMSLFTRIVSKPVTVEKVRAELESLGFAMKGEDGR